MRWPVVEIRTASSLNSGVQPALVVLITFHILTDIEPLGKGSGFPWRGVTYALSTFPASLSACSTISYARSAIGERYAFLLRNIPKGRR